MLKSTRELETHYNKKFSCIYCGEPFTSLRIRSRFSIPYQIDSDFCPHYKNKEFNPHYYYVNVCSECGFAFSEEFSDEFPLGSKEMIKVQIKDQWEKRDFSKQRDLRLAIDSYKLAIYSGSIKREKHVALGGLCLRLAWIYREENNIEQEQRFLSLALKEFEESFLISDFSGSSLSELKMLYICGELHRRLGDLTKAISYFAKIIEHPQRDDERKMLNMAREQWKITVEENRKKRKT
ncbi:MAG: DUF2225 domain-containing protein [Desulfitobacteriaceae bacterium]